MAVEVWEAVLAGVVALLLLWWWTPGLRRSIREAPKGTAADWKAAIVPIVVVAAFVVLLVVMVS